MKNQLFNRKGLLALTFVSAWSFTGCESDNPEPDPDPIVEVEFAISTVSGAWPDQTTYIQGGESLDFTSLGNNNAIELTGSARTVSYGSGVYATPFGAPANLVKYTMNDQGVPEEVERIVVPGANTFSTLYFESETVAYGTVAGGISKLIVFDPSTMRISDEVSLTSVTEDIPEATRTYYLDMIARNGKLFMGVHYENNFIPVNDNAYIVVIDLSTNSVDKVISDTRTGMVFGGQAPNAGMIMDANGDIYVQALGTTNAGGVAPSGVLRIKKDQSDFDPDYFFNLEEAVGNICYGIYHTSTGRTFTANVQDETDFWEFATGQPQFKYAEIDLEGTESLGHVPGLPTTYGSRVMIIHEQEDQSLLFSIATNDENAMYKYDPETNTSSMLFVSTGGYITGLEKLN